MREKIKPVGIWLRVSTEEQANGESPVHHEKRARAFAEIKEWRVVEVYDLCGVSGKAVLDHPECKRLFVDVKQGKIEAIIFSKLARLARNTRELLDFAEYFEKHNADLVSLHESIDTSSPAGRLFFTVIAALAQFEREEISERVRASVPIRAKLGKSLGRKAVYGYQWLDGALVPHPEEAPVRRLMHELFAKHKRKRQVARLLNEQGYRTRSGAKWTDTSVDRLLRDSTAKGIHVANRTQKNSAGDGTIPKDESEWIERPVPPIVSVELWDQCAAIVAQNATGKKITRSTKHLLSGKVFCGCGAKMYPRSKNPAYVCNGERCRKKIPIDDLDAIFLEQLKSFAFSNDEIAEHFGKASELIQQKETEVAILKREQQKLQKEMDRIYDLYIDEALDTEGFARRNRPMEERFRQIEAQLPELEAEIDVLKTDYLNREEIVSEAKTLGSEWPHLSFEDQRAIVESIVDRIAVDEGQIHIELLYLPQESGANSAATHGGNVEPRCERQRA